LLLIFTILLLSSCFEKEKNDGAKFKAQFQLIDSLNFAGKNDTAKLILRNLRQQIPNSNAQISTYYTLRAKQTQANLKLMNLYADSAMAFFSTESRINNNPEEYFSALLIKGDASLKQKKYVTALSYYYKAQNVLAKLDTAYDNGDLASKMGTIYFNQKNFQLAGKYWAQSAKNLEKHPGKFSADKIFFIEQGALNNAGVSYERGGFLDSANYYYLQDLKLINKSDFGNPVLKREHQAALSVVYDNLGGINLKKGNFATAIDYLDKCLAIPNPNTDGAKIPPLIKLAELYLETGNNAKAAEAFVKSKALLDKFYNDNPESYIKWNKEYAQYLYNIRQPDLAYQYQAKYLRLKDSVENNRAELYRLDVDRELNTLQQQETVTDLQQKDKVRQLYLVGIGIFVLLSFAIIFLINQNLKRSKINQKQTALKNEQLQLALSELERVNKNYIRIMRVMAHDLRNPLSGMTGIAAMLLGDDEFSEESKHMLKLIETTGAHTMEMINELLKTGLADENEPMQKQSVDLNSLLFDSVELLQFRADEKKQQLVFEGSKEPIIAEINHEKIWRVFNNLIVNAIKFSHDGGIIRVSIARNKNQVLISIADSGIGIPETEKDSIFEMFTPAKKFGTNGEQPFGLGLSISKKIVEMHKGKIWFESKVGEGTTFYIELPVSK